MVKYQSGESGNPAGRPRKDSSLKALLRRQPVKDKRELVQKAFEYAKGGSASWAEWIAKHSGEGSTEQLEHTGELTVRVVYEDDPPMATSVGSENEP